jgi:NADP-dependent 3-hydroxy acid dehydrogenase YdfG
MKPLKDQVALVTGAGSGIGAAVAAGLGARGADLWLVGRRREPLEAVAEAARGQGVTARVHSTDLTVDDQVRTLADQVEHDAGRLDLLVHSAGVMVHADLEEAAIHDLDAHYAANVRAPYLLTQSVLPMLRAREGQIVFVNSSIYPNARAGVGQYAASKYALKAVADSLRDEVNPHGIRVLSIFPGRTATPGQAQLHELEGKEYRPDLLVQPEDVAAIAIGALELPRTAEVTEISIRPMAKP